MAITKLDTPSGFTNPAYNTLPFVLDSDNKTENRFSYIIDMGINYWNPDSMSVTSFNGRDRLKLSSSTTDHQFKVGDTISLVNNFDGSSEVLKLDGNDSIITDVLTSNPTGSTPDVRKLFRQEIKPRPSDGLAVFDGSDLAGALVNNNFRTDLTGVTANSNIVEAIKVLYHELFTKKWEFNDHFSAGTANVGFTGTSQPFEVGDRIYIEQNSPDLDKVDRILPPNSINPSEIRVSGDSTQLFSVDDKLTIKNAKNSSNNITTNINEPPFFDNILSETVIHVNGSLKKETGSTATISIPVVDSYNGRVTVNQASSTDIIVDVPYQYDVPKKMSGIARLANDSRALTLSQASSETFEIFDGALKEVDARSWNSNNYVMSNNNKGDFLTEFNPTYTTLSGYSKLEMISGIDVLTPSNEIKDVVIIATNTSGGKDTMIIDAKSFAGFNESINRYHSIHSGPAQINKITSTGGDVSLSGVTRPLPLIKNDVVEYEIFARDGNGNNMTNNRKVYKIYENSPEKECRSTIPLHRLVYKDRYGSFDGIVFYTLKQGSISYNRTEFRQSNLDTRNNVFNKSSEKRSRTNIFTEATKEIQLSTGFINKQEFKQVESLLDSPEVYFEFDDNGEIVPVIINSEDVEIIEDGDRSLKEVIITFQLPVETRQRN